jgi:cytochrome c-type biogenesis protein CcmH
VHIWLIAIVFLAACDKSASAPPPNAQQAAKGLPPSGPAGAGSTGSPALPPGHPHVSGPASAAAPASAPASAGATIEGTIDVAPALKDQVKPGDTLFIVARAVDASGTVQRMPVAVDRLQVSSWPLAFKLSSANVMVAGTPFAGQMQLTARVDKDGEAMTRAAGDVEGTVKVTVPQKGITITLDTPVKP